MGVGGREQGDGDRTEAWRRDYKGSGAGVYKQKATSHVERRPTPELRTLWEREMAICPIRAGRKAHQHVKSARGPAASGARAAQAPSRAGARSLLAISIYLFRYAPDRRCNNPPTCHRFRSSLPPTRAYSRLGGVSTKERRVNCPPQTMPKHEDNTNRSQTECANKPL